MAIRKVYWSLVKQKKLNTFFRPGKRLCYDFRGYCESQLINLRCLNQPGSDYHGIAPEFANEKVEVNIERIYSKKLSDLTKSDFVNSSPDLQSVNDLKYHLGLIYNLSIDELKDDSYVTIINVNYNMKNSIENKNELRLENLLQNGLWEIAKKPILNSSNFQTENIMVTLIDHDYPARTPLLWNNAFKHFNIDAKSIVLSPRVSKITKEDLDLTLKIYRDDKRFKVGGFGVGFKDQSIELLDELDSSALNVGAANFVKKNNEGKLVGYNTDGLGFVQGLKENFSALKELKNKKVLLLGSGGTANSIAFALVKEGVELIIANRTEEKAKKLAISVNEFYQPSIEVIGVSEKEIENYISDVDILINSSIKGAEGTWKDYLAVAETVNLKENLDKGRIILDKLKPNAIVSDIILKSEDTPLILEAKKRNLKTMDGLPMVVSQAALAFTLSYGKTNNICFSEVYEMMKKLV
jgi:shikimate dehydrogenase